MDYVSNITKALKAVAALGGLAIILAFAFGVFSKENRAIGREEPAELPIETEAFTHTIGSDYSVDGPRLTDGSRADADTDTGVNADGDKTIVRDIHKYTIICTCFYEEEKQLEVGPGLVYKDKYSITWRRSVETPFSPSQVNTLADMQTIGFCPYSGGVAGEPISLISVWYFGIQ